MYTIPIGPAILTQWIQTDENVNECGVSVVLWDASKITNHVI